MKAAVQEQPNQPMTIMDVPTPEHGASEVLVRVAASGVCHTDLHVADGFWTMLGVNKFPIIMGHEVVGVVEQIGNEVKHVQVGDRVTAYWAFGCGHCHYCLSGKEQICPVDGMNPYFGINMDGGYAEYVKIPADFAVPLPAGLDFVEAAPFLCAGITMYGGLKNAHLSTGQRVAVLGVGGLGHMAIQIAHALGAEVIAVTSSADKQQLAKQMGAHETVVAEGSDVGSRLLAMGGVDIVLSSTLDPKAIASSMDSLRPHGTLVVTGLTTEPLPINPTLLALTERRVIGSVIGSRPDLMELLELAVRHNIRPLVEAYPLDAANEVHDRLRANRVRFRAVLTPN